MHACLNDFKSIWGISISICPNIFAGNSTLLVTKNFFSTVHFVLSHPRASTIKSLPNLKIQTIYIFFVRKFYICCQYLFFRIYSQPNPRVSINGLLPMKDKNKSFHLATVPISLLLDVYDFGPQFGFPHFTVNSVY